MWQLSIVLFNISSHIKNTGGNIDSLFIYLDVLDKICQLSVKHYDYVLKIKGFLKYQLIFDTSQLSLF